MIQDEQFFHLYFRTSSQPLWFFLDDLRSVPNITIASSYSGRFETSMVEVFAKVTSKSCELFF